MRCPITYDVLEDPLHRYSLRGLQLLSPRLRRLKDLPYSQSEQLDQARRMAGKLSIQGVQPKLSAALNAKEETFELTDRGGTYIIKMQSSWPTLPENEDLTMRLAVAVGIEVPLHGLVYCKGGTLSYWIRRFDRKGEFARSQEKFALEDFAQLSGELRTTKYESSLEKVTKIIETCTTFPVVELEKFFLLTLFNFLVGNEDMHLKNFSLLNRQGCIGLSPAYDLVNTTLALGQSAGEESALPLNGKKNKLTRKDFIDYFALSRLNLVPARVEKMMTSFIMAFPVWKDLIEASFLPPESQEAYWKIVQERRMRLFE